MTGQSPAQASVAPSPLRQEPQVPQPSMGAPYAPVQDKPDPSKGIIRFPVVKLGRLSVSFVFMLRRFLIAVNEVNRKIM